jgi:phosphate:Na+ symporter
MEGFDIWKLLAGLGIFVFGMALMEETVKKLSGRAFKRFIRQYTNGRLRAIGAGALVTAILQSSSAVSLMVLAFVGAGIMTLENSIGVILGSNIGTTATSWIVGTVGFKLKIEAFALPLVGIGGAWLLLLGARAPHIGRLFLSFGFLFMGLDYMKTSVEMLAGHFDMSQVPDYGPLAYVLVGLLLTAVMQSSSAAMAVVLTALHAGLVDFQEAAGTVIGSNVGTTVTILLGAAGGSQVKKRVAFSHFIFNLLTGVLALLLLPALAFGINTLLELEGQPVMGLVVFHTAFNVMGVLAFFPFISLLSKALLRLFPDRKERISKFIGDATPEVPEAAITAIRKEAGHLLAESMRYNLGALRIDEQLVFDGVVVPSLPSKGQEGDARYERLKLLEAGIVTFAAQVQAHGMSEAESQELGQCLHGARMALHAAKTMKDVSHDFEAFESADAAFLNEQYVHFRRRLIALYLSIEKLQQEAPDPKGTTKGLLKLFRQVKEADRQFLAAAMQEAARQRLSDLDLSTAMMANRAFAQSGRQVLLALRELLLPPSELQQFDWVQEVSDTLLEQE